MNESQEKLHTQTGGEDAAVSSRDDSDSLETPSRRELIERYAKYAIVGAPLLLFVSKAHAAHSAP
jgi:hypothetical protein